MRAPGDELELVQAAAAGDPAAVAALWDAHGPRAFAFCQRLLGNADLAADAAQDAFLLAHAELPRLARTQESFGVALLAAARRTSNELLAREPRVGGARDEGLAAAAGRLRPQQRAALALAGLEKLPYAALAAVLGIGVEAVPALLARARLRLRDELHGTALAAAAVRSPDCEDVVPLLAAAADGELDPADAAWADPHVTRCPSCPRARRAMAEAAATYAAWSPAAPPSWLRGATLAEVGAEAPTGAPVPAAAGPPSPRRARRRAAGAWVTPRPARRRAAGAWVTPRPNLSAALLGATLLTVAFAALLLATVGSLRQEDPLAGGARLRDGARSVQVAAAPAARGARPEAKRRAHHARRARSAARTHTVAFVAVRAVRPVAPRVPTRPLRHRAPTRPHTPAARPKRTRTPRPTPLPPTPTPPAPVSADAPADEAPATTDGSATTVAAVAPVSSAPATPVPTPTTPTKPKAPVTTATPPPPFPAGEGRHRGDRDKGSHGGSCGRHGRH